MVWHHYMVWHHSNANKQPMQLWIGIHWLVHETFKLPICTYYSSIYCYIITGIHGSRKSVYQTDEDEASSTQSENS